MRRTPLFVLIFILLGMSLAARAQTPLGFIAVPSCRVVDTRLPNGPFGGPPIQGEGFRDFALPSGPCQIPDTAAAYSLNVTVVPRGPLGYVTVWPTGQPQPNVSTLNSQDGRVKANAAIVPPGAGGAISVFATDTTDVILDINGYFVPATDPAALDFFPLTPCRVIDTRLGQGGPTLQGMTDYTIQGICGIPNDAQAYSFNFTVVPANNVPVGYLTVWPYGPDLPNVSTLNDYTGTVVANAGIVPAGMGGEISAYVYTTGKADLLVDVNGYFAPSNSGASNPLSLYTVTPCRVLDTRLTHGAFSGKLEPPVNFPAAPCGVPDSAQAFVMNATVVPQGSLGYLTLWPDGASMPNVSTLNAYDGMITSNMAIVPTTDGWIDAFVTDPSYLLLDVSGYFAPRPLIISTTSLPPGTVNVPYSATLSATGGLPPYTWSVILGSLPSGLTLNATSGVISGTPTTAGTSNFTVRVRDSDSPPATATAPRSITVTAGPGFTISASPSSLTIQQGNQRTSTITTAITGGFNSSIALSYSGAPSGTTVSFSPNPIAAPGSGSSTMTITVEASTPTGTYPITVTGNGGGVQQNTTVTLTVTSQGQGIFTLSAAPSSLSVAQGNQGTSTITSTISNGFNSAIALSASSMPSGTTVSFSPNPIAAPGSGSSTMTITAGSNTPTGTYPITVTGNGGGVQQNTTLNLTVTALVALSWAASTSPGVIGYNAYRSMTSGGPYTKLNSSLISTTNYTDQPVQSGPTYYYVTTAVNSQGQESVYSNQAAATVP